MPGRGRGRTEEKGSAVATPAACSQCRIDNRWVVRRVACHGWLPLIVLPGSAIVITLLGGIVVVSTADEDRERGPTTTGFRNRLETFCLTHACPNLDMQSNARTPVPSRARTQGHTSKAHTRAQMQTKPRNKRVRNINCHCEQIRQETWHSCRYHKDCTRWLCHSSSRTSHHMPSLE